MAAAFETRIKPDRKVIKNLFIFKEGVLRIKRRLIIDHCHLYQDLTVSHAV